MVLLPHENDHSHCRASAGENEPGGGPAVKDFYGCQQLETGGPNFSGAGEQMGSIQGGHVCRQAEQAKVETFYSWRPDPLAAAMDAFMMPWGCLKGYMFPPFCMIGRCLAKVRKERATVVLVALNHGSHIFS